MSQPTFQEIMDHFKAASKLLKKRKIPVVIRGKARKLSTVIVVKKSEIND